MRSLEDLQVEDALNSTVVSTDLRTLNSDEPSRDHRVLGHYLYREQNLPEDSP